MYLRPSEICFSQDSINNVFDKRCNHRYKPIGETLDEICEGRCSVSAVPTITVVQQGGKWTTADNRRLWVFRQLERLGKCEKIFVKKGFYIPDGKLTSVNGGVSVLVRGSPRGYWHSKPSVIKPVSKVTNPNTRSNLSTNISIPPASPVKQSSTNYYNQLNRGTSAGSLREQGSNFHSAIYGQGEGFRKSQPTTTVYSTRLPGTSTPRSPVSPAVNNQFGKPAYSNQTLHDSPEWSTEGVDKETITNARHSTYSDTGSGSLSSASGRKYASTGGHISANSSVKFHTRLPGTSNPRSPVSPGVNNQIGKPAYFNQTLHDGPNWSTERVDKETITNARHSTYSDTGSGSLSSASGRRYASTGGHSSANSVKLHMPQSTSITENDGYSARHAPKTSADNYRTYDTSYSQNRQRSTDSSSTRDNACCVIL